MKLKTVLIAAALALSSTVVNATSITVDFPSPTSTIVASGGQFFFLPSHSVNETFTGTGIGAATSLNLDLILQQDVLNSGAFVNFNVLLNSIVVGNFSFDQNATIGLHSFSFSFASVVGSGTYNIALAVTNTVPVGEGSVAFARTGSKATITGDVAVPEPTSVLLLGIGLLALGIMHARNRRIALKD